MDVPFRAGRVATAEKRWADGLNSRRQRRFRECRVHRYQGLWRSPRYMWLGRYSHARARTDGCQASEIPDQWCGRGLRENHRPAPGKRRKPRVRALPRSARSPRSCPPRSRPAETGVTLPSGTIQSWYARSGPGGGASASTTTPASSRRTRRPSPGHRRSGRRRAARRRARRAPPRCGRPAAGPAPPAARCVAEPLLLHRVGRRGRADAEDTDDAPLRPRGAATASPGRDTASGDRPAAAARWPRRGRAPARASAAAAPTRSPSASRVTRRRGSSATSGAQVSHSARCRSNAARSRSSTASSAYAPPRAWMSGLVMAPPRRSGSRAAGSGRPASGS